MLFKIILLIPIISQIAANYESEPPVYENGIDRSFRESSKELKVTFATVQDIQLKSFQDALIAPSTNRIFFLIRPDLHILEIDGDRNKTQNLKMLVRLANIDNQAVLDVKATLWRDYEIFIVALASYYNIYVYIPEVAPIQVDPLQSLPKFGSKTQMDFFRFNHRLYCAILNGLRNSEEGSMLYIYKWRKSHFTLVKETSTKGVNEFFVYSTKTVAVIVTVNYMDVDVTQPKNTVLNVYTLSEEDSLRHIQVLYSNAVKVFPVTLANTFYIFIVSHTGNVDSYYWDSYSFEKWRNYGITHATHFASGEKMVIGEVNGKLFAYTNAELATAYEITTNSSKNPDEIIITQLYGVFYVTLVYKTADELTLKVLEAKYEDVDEENVGEVVSPTGNCLTNLRTIQRNRLPYIEVIKKMIPLVYYKDQEAHAETQVSIGTVSVTKKARIRRINVNVDLKVSLKQLKDKIEKLRLKLHSLKETSRRKRDMNNLLEATTVTVKNLNIPEKLFEHVLVKTNGKATLAATLTTDSLSAKSIRFEHASDSILGAVSPDEHQKVDNLESIRNLNVQTINGINWNDFYQSLYLTGSPKPIKGNLIVTKPFRAEHVIVKTVNEFPVDTFVTLNTDQEISSDIFIGNFYSESIETKLLNGIDFQNDVAKVDEENVIETPVKIPQVHIGNLTLANSDDDEMIKRHVVGTRVEDLSQVYNKKVVIKGSLKLSYVMLDSPKTNVIVDEQTFFLNVADHYWVKSVDQHLGVVTFSSVISTPQLFADAINNVPKDNLIITNVAPQKPVNLVFQRIFVHGNVNTDPHFETTLSRINKECVRRGTVSLISGPKIFTGLLSANIFSGRFFDFPGEDIFVLNNNIDNRFFFNCTKQFDSVNVIGNVEFATDNLVITHFNGVNLLEFFQNAVMVNQPSRLDNLTFTKIKTANLTASHINRHSFDVIASGIENSVGTQGNLKSVRVNGDVNIIGNLILTRINDINFDNHLGLIVTSLSGGQIGGTKRFLAGLTVTNLFVRRVNSIDFGFWFENALHKHSDQYIGYNWTLPSVGIGDMNVNMINGIKMKEIIDVTANIIDIRSDIRAKSMTVLSNMNGRLPCDVAKLDYVLESGPAKKNWNFVNVNGYVEWPEGNSPINDIMNFAMTESDQVITGGVTFTNVTSIQNCQSTGVVNNINVGHIFKDAVVKESQLQIIKGSKIFQQPLTVRNMAVEGNLQTPFINGVDLVALNNSIFRIGGENIISGTKTFNKTPLINKLILDGTINGVYVRDIVFANSTAVLPPISFSQPISIKGHVILANDINRINFNYIIDHMVRKTGPPQEITSVLTFQNLIIQGDAKLPRINDVDLSNVVMKASDSVQEILDHKSIVGDVNLYGPTVVTNINGLDVIDAYSNSIFLDENMVLPKLDVIGAVLVHQGIKVNSQLNQLPILPLINWKLPTKTDLVPMWSNVFEKLDQAKQILYQNYGKSFHLLYLDYAPNIKIKFDSNSNYPVSYIVDTVHTGEECGLDHKCECPAQYDISLSPLGQIHINRRPFFDRMFKIIGFNCNVTVSTKFLHTCEPNSAVQTLMEWSTPTGSGTITIDEVIFRVKLFEIGSEAFILINQINGTITALKLDRKANNWFKSEQINGNNVHLDVLEWKIFKVLITFGTISDTKQDAVARLFFYNMDEGEHHFQLFHEISGEYNLCSKIYMRNDDKFVLFLSKTDSQFISVFMVHWGAQFQFFQTLVLDAGIKTFVTFAVDDQYCLAIVTTTGYLYLYKYNNIEGWTPMVHGLFTEIESIVPFNHVNQIYLFVSMKNSATVIRVYSQGLH